MCLPAFEWRSPVLAHAPSVPQLFHASCTRLSILLPNPSGAPFLYLPNPDPPLPPSPLPFPRQCVQSPSALSSRLPLHFHIFSSLLHSHYVQAVGLEPGDEKLSESRWGPGLEPQPAPADARARVQFSG